MEPQCSTQARYPLPATGSALDLLVRRAEAAPTHPAFALHAEGGWRTVTTGEFADRVAALGAGLRRAGISAGDRVALMGPASYPWILCDFAIWAAGAITVPIYETSSPDQISWILRDSGASAAFVADERLRTLVLRAAPTPTIPLWVMADDGLDVLAQRPDGTSTDLATMALQNQNPSAPATIVYTSGTTGRPKGCVLTHANLLSEVGNIVTADGVSDLLLTQRSRLLLFLPQAHILTRVVQLVAVHNGALIAYTSDLARLTECLADFRPTVFLGVPRVFEKFRNAAAEHARTGLAHTVYRMAETTAVDYSTALAGPSTPGWWLRARHAVFDRTVYPRLRAALGGEVRYAVSGGAPLAPWLGHFCRGIGVTVLEGWGLTETTAGVTLNLPANARVGTVGPPVPGCALRIAQDGEVLVRGPNVFVGYWGNPDATREALTDDGWLHTGDIGSLDRGYLRIIGRKKELIVTASGKNVAPAPFEDTLRTHWLVDQCVVVGDNRPFVGALITLDHEALASWRNRNRPSSSAPVTELVTDTELVATVQQAVNEANAKVSSAESVRRFRILATEFTVADELTPTQKVRRSHVMAKFAREIDQLYADRS